MISIGSIIGAAIGWYIWHIPGAILGFAVGFYFDRGLRTFQQQIDPETRKKIELTIFQTVFPLLGNMAKADGRVSAEEIAAAEELMARMQLQPELRKEAIHLFQLGTQADFSVQTLMQQFMSQCGRYPDLKQMLLVYLISMAMSDGHLHQSEQVILAEVSRLLGYPPNAFEHLLRMAEAQGYFHQTRAGTSPEQALTLAYQALGIEPNVDDNQLKRSYRKLMSQYHPDKLSGQGAPEEMIKLATERSQEIQAAYDLIKKQRSGGH